ncbi:helix-turn-helix transcriptional regulator [Flavobacterium sp.]|uniref:helix-turn-helix domain-containing protein n=1 Tax=Flavobacterium sp. TaxID=239 RepID=UPI0025BF14D1|nr:helix-turn-helix transcriptional regulator [Flavobacterium sp.]
MRTIGELIRAFRESKGLLLRQVASTLEVDPSLLSKIERGDKRPTKEQVKRLAKLFETEEKELMLAYLSDRLVYEIRNEDLASEALKVAEQKIEYLKKSNVIF